MLLNARTAVRVARVACSRTHWLPLRRCSTQTSRVSVKNCRITTTINGGKWARRREGEGQGAYWLWPQQQLRQHWRNNVVCNCRLINSVAKRIHATPQTARFPLPLFFSFLVVLLFSVVAHILNFACSTNVYCNCRCRCSLSTAFANTGVGSQTGGGVGPTRVRLFLARLDLAWLGFMATLHSAQK